MNGEKGETKERPKTRRMDIQRISKSLSLYPSGRRICPAAMEATRVALAARAEYSRRRPHASLEKAAFLIVTRDGDERLDELEMAVILDKSSNRFTVRQSKSHRDPERSSGREGLGDSTESGTRSGMPSQKRRRLASIDGASHHSDGRHRHNRSRGRHSVVGSPTHLDNLSPIRPPSSASITTQTTAADEAKAQENTSPKLEPSTASMTESHSLEGDGPRADRRRESSTVEQQGHHWGWPRSTSRVVGSSSSRSSVLRFAAAGAIMLTGTCAFVASYVVGRRETWTLVGSAITSISCLLLVIGVCCHLANTRDRSIGSHGSVEIKVIDQKQLAKFIRMGLRVENVTV